MAELIKLAKMSGVTHEVDHVYSRPVELVRPLRPWSDQKFHHCWSNFFILKDLVGRIIVRSRFCSDGQTNPIPLLPIPPPPVTLSRAPGDYIDLLLIYHS